MHISWATYFTGLDRGLPSSSAYTPPPGFSGGAGGVPVPAEGTTKMDVRGGDEVTDYLKVYIPCGSSRVKLR